MPNPTPADIAREMIALSENYEYPVVEAAKLKILATALLDRVPNADIAELIEDAEAWASDLEEQGWETPPEVLRKLARALLDAQAECERLKDAERIAWGLTRGAFSTCFALYDIPNQYMPQLTLKRGKWEFIYRPSTSVTRVRDMAHDDSGMVILTDEAREIINAAMAAESEVE
jgi:hypothetical protein